MMVGVIQPRGWVSDADKARLRAALDAREASEKELRAAVLDATAHGASVRELAAFTGLSPATINRWRQASSR
jgi:DNA-binding MurR/RpiR family transcriptional regulator